MVAFPCKNSAPVEGITLSTRVGRLSRTHFELGFSVNAIVSLGRRAMEQQGGKVSLNCIVEQCWHSQVAETRTGCTAAGDECLWGGNMKDHESKSGKVESQLVKERAGTQCGVPHCFTTN